MYPFPRDLEDVDSPEELPDDPHGVLEHLAGPDWSTPPQHPEALKLWRSEVKRTIHNFNKDVYRILEALEEKNAGCDPENYKVNGQVSRNYVIKREHL
jgi:hypothetical protein